MLKKIYRLKRKEIELFFGSKSRYARGKLVSVKYRRTTNKISRFAFVVSSPKKRFAAKRNLLRRRLSEIVRRKLGEIPTGPDGTVGAGWDIVFFLKPKGPQIPTFRELKEDIEYVLSRNIL